jgi:hypothetical protein
LIEKTKHIKKNLTAQKQFCFAYSLLPIGAVWEANAHRTSRFLLEQIAQADPETEICKRVQFIPTIF